MKKNAWKSLLLAVTLLGFSNQIAIALFLDFTPDYSGTDLKLTPEEREQIFPKAATTRDSDEAKLLRLNTALEHYPGNATLLVSRAIVLANLKDYKKALEDISGAIKVSPEREGYYWIRAQIRLQLDNYDDALDDCKFARRIAAGSIGWNSYWLSSQIFLAMGRPRESEKAARDALNSMINYGVTNKYDRAQVHKLIGNGEFHPTRKTAKLHELVKAIDSLANLEKPPSDQELLTLLRLKSEDLIQPFKPPNEHLELVQISNTPWIRIQKHFSGDDRKYFSGVTLDVDCDQCSATESDMKRYLKLVESRTPNEGPEKSVLFDRSKCSVALIFQPGGFRSLSSIEFNWRR